MAMATSLSTLNLHPSLKNHNPKYFGLRPVTLLKKLRNRYHIDRLAVTSFNRLVIRATTEGSAKSSQSDEKIPSWARPDADEPPPWAQGSGNGSSSQSTFEIPFYAYLLASAITAIAAIGSVFEYVNQNPVFGVLSSDSVFYAPLLGFFAFTGIPTSAFLWYKSVQVANKEAEEQDRKDGYL
ncbi:uncharacterized protein A4U43_C02F19950 [Asparagus officinalis]|uniref:Uncharacterized protein n=1 Tax=Asparagus officinalis TaxID=4686 RepID=A0A5P1FKF3_ASPOF|nr:uncharacterized protein LOC109829662 [Asparagus officinalis]ONK78544.1 uncharacterized protein A4U43_C02F19950 [Asparagus officinalis]